MKTCQHCGEKIFKNKTFCTHCGSEQPKLKDKKVRNNDNKSRSKKPLIVLIIVGVLVIGGLAVKKTLMCHYYVYRASNESSVTQSVNYYKKAMNIKYNRDLLENIENELRKSDNPESVILSLKDVLTSEDLQNLYISTYVYKAKENFKEKNYETVWNYLDKAESRGYDINNFEYYGDLNKIKEKEDRLASHILPDTNSLAECEFIIQDSDTKYLTRKDLASYTKEELALIRNEIFARYGYVFKTQEYKDYFSNKPWYTQNPSFKGDESELNPIEKANVGLIKTMEKE